MYRTVSGDTWDLIAFKIYGSEGYFHDLIRSNLRLIDIAIFDADIPIIIPEITDEENDNDERLPPWKRGE